MFKKNKKDEEEMKIIDKKVPYIIMKKTIYIYEKHLPDINNDFNDFVEKWQKKEA